MNNFETGHEQSNSKISILLVEDQTLVRQGIARLLNDEPDMEVIGQISSGEGALKYMEQRGADAQPDVVVMDARMSGIVGIEAARQMLEKYPQTRIVAVSSVASGVIPSQMLRAGAQAFVTKNVDREELIKAIHMVSKGHHYVTPEVAVQLATDPFSQEGRSIFDKLSRRELQISQLLTDGKKVSQISTLLNLSPKTVYSYRYRIFEKFGIRSDVELTILAVKHGLAHDSGDHADLMYLKRAAS